jgi:hypothetical protein
MIEISKPNMASCKKLHHDDKHILSKQNLRNPLPLSPLDYIKVHHKIHLLQQVQKKDTDQTVIKSVALETIHTLHPKQSHLYTWFSDRQE